MKKTMFIAIVLAAEFFAPLFGKAQGTVYVSSLDQTPNGSEAIGSDSWLAQPFRTGTDSGGYVLNSVQLLMDAASGSPSGFSVSIYSSLNPISNLGNFVGSDPSAGGVFTYTTSGITLSPSTSYFIVVTATTPVVEGAYNWSTTVGVEVSGANQWLISGRLESSDGSSWNPEARGDIFQMAINVTTVPEPTTYALSALGALLLGFHRWRNSSR